MQQKWNNGKKDIKLKQIYLRISLDLPSLNNVQEPRNAEFTVLLGSFYVVWQSNDNKVGK